MPETLTALWAYLNVEPAAALLLLLFVPVFGLAAGVRR